MPFEKRLNGLETPRPGLKDLLKIDGRWAQCLGHNLFRFLDTNKTERRDLEQYRLARKIKTTLEVFLASAAENVETKDKVPTSDEIENLAEEGTRLEWLTVFGEYEKLDEQ